MLCGGGGTRSISTVSLSGKETLRYLGRGLFNHLRDFVELRFVRLNLNVNIYKDPHSCEFFHTVLGTVFEENMRSV